MGRLFGSVVTLGQGLGGLAKLGFAVPYGPRLPFVDGTGRE